jgi:putative hydrolase
MSVIRLDEDLHVHSTFSDGADTLEQNLAAATAAGLRRLGCVDHVRRDTTYVPDYARAVAALRRTTAIEMTIGVEAKILAADGTLDVPNALDHVDYIYVADHQFPDVAGPVSPRVMRDAIAGGGRDAAAAIDMLATALVASMERYAGAHRLVLAHLFSILPKMGLAESMASDAAVERVVRSAAETRTVIEVSERWRCPSGRVVAAALHAGVDVRASTDSHRAADIGKYTYVAALAAELDGHHAPAA